jgi:hypothetical protein
VCGVASLFILRRDSQTALPNFSVGQLSARKIWLLHGAFKALAQQSEY